jgi:hypothetical protein
MMSSVWTDRRGILAGLACLPLAGCTSIDACESMADPSQRASCRNQAAFEKHLAVISIAAVLGAAAGYGISRAVKSNPVGTALVGAFAAGGMAASLHYSTYLMEKANNDRLLAMDLLKGAIQQDIEWHRRTYADINGDIDQALGELRGITRPQQAKQVSISEQANRARGLIKKIKNVDMGSPTFIEAAKLYPPVITLVSDRRTDPPMVQKQQESLREADTLLRESTEQQRRTQASVQALHKMGFFE